MDDFIAKPATLSDLSRAISSVIRSADHRDSDGSGVPDDSDTAVDDPSPVGRSAGTVTDPDVLAALAEDLGDATTVREIVVTFLEHLDVRIAAIVDADDDSSLRRAAHALGSSALLVGARLLGEHCRSIERGTSASTGIVELADRSRAELAAWLGR
jgi:HPt (histidine-containing phosphotransfer) domain-containing protein